MSTHHVRAALLEAQEALAHLLSDEVMLERINAAGNLMADALQSGGRIYSCGNGGSLCDAMHFAEEMTGRYRNNRLAYAATAIADASHMACVANDFGYEYVFSRYIEGVARSGDVLLGISTSGTSKNVLRAVEASRAKGVKVVSLTGRADSPIAKLSDVAIVTPGGRYADRGGKEGDEFKVCRNSTSNAFTSSLSSLKDALIRKIMRASDARPVKAL